VAILFSVWVCQVLQVQVLHVLQGQSTTTAYAIAQPWRDSPFDIGSKEQSNSHVRMFAVKWAYLAMQTDRPTSPTGTYSKLLLQRLVIFAQAFKNRLMQELLR
jgi:hypothetical protein